MSKITALKIQMKSAIESNNLKLLDDLLSNEMNLNQLKSYKYFDVYVQAIKLNQLHLIKYFYSKGFPINCTFNTNKRKRQQQQQQQQKQKIEYENDDDENDCEIKVKHYSNALIEAVKCLNLKAIKLLIELDVDLNSTDYKHIPIQIAYNLYQKLKSNNESKVKIKKCYKIMKLMLNNNANPNIYNNDGLRLIHQIILDKNLEILKLLLNCANFNVNVLTYGKMQNALHLVSETRRSRSRINQASASNLIINDDYYQEDNNEEVFEYEIDCEEIDKNDDDDDDDEIDDKDDEIEIFEANNDEEINIKLARLLIKAECNMNHRDFNLHETPIFKAIVLNDYNLVKLFIIEGIDINLRNIFGNDALSRSIQLGRFKISRLLIDIDAQIRKSTCFYKMPRNDEIVKSIYFNQQQQQQQQASNDILLPFLDNISSTNHENILMTSLSKYEDFLKYLKEYTNDKPRSLVDLARLKVRKLIKKPISKYIFNLNLPNRLYDLILLKDIE